MQGKTFTASLEITVPDGVSREQVMYYLQNLVMFTKDIRSVQHIKVNRLLEETTNGRTSSN